MYSHEDEFRKAIKKQEAARRKYEGCAACTCGALYRSLTDDTEKEIQQYQTDFPESFFIEPWNKGAMELLLETAEMEQMKKLNLMEREKLSTSMLAIHEERMRLK